MEPRISSLIEENGFLKFTITDCNVSIANALRRIIISDIPTFVFRTFPYSENKCEIYKNTTRFNNEIIKQRLGCIPIYIDDVNFPYKDYVMELNVKNDSDTIQYITTKDFKIKNKKTQQYSESSVHTIFPHDKISGDYIEFVRLQPKLSDNIDSEQISLICDFDIGTASEDGMFNVASTCSYSNTLDKNKAKEKWSEIEKTLKKENLNQNEIEFQEKNWYLLEAKRFFIENSFDFIIESIGVFSNIDLVTKACNIMIKKCKNFLSMLEQGEISITPSDSTLTNGYDIILKNEDYTLGKVIEFFLYQQHYMIDKTVSFCGFKKPHPHSLDSMIRIAFHKPVDKIIVNNYLQRASDNAITAFNGILSQFVEGEPEVIISQPKTNKTQEKSKSKKISVKKSAKLEIPPMEEMQELEEAEQEANE